LAVTDWRLRRWRLWFFGAYNSYPNLYILNAAEESYLIGKGYHIFFNLFIFD